jgi:hypothetical protein
MRASASQVRDTENSEHGSIGHHLAEQLQLFRRQLGR